MRWIRAFSLKGLWRRFISLSYAAAQTKSENRAMSVELVALVQLGEERLPIDSWTEWEQERRQKHLNRLALQIVDAQDGICSGIACDQVFATIDSLIEIFERTPRAANGLRSLRVRLEARLEMGCMSRAPHTLASFFARWTNREAA